MCERGGVPGREGVAFPVRLPSVARQTHSTHARLEMERGVKYKRTAEAEADGQLPWTSLAIASCMATQEAAHVPWCLLPAAWADSALLQTATGGSCGLQCLPGICHCPTGGQRGTSGGHCGATPSTSEQHFQIESIHCVPQTADPLKRG